MAQKSRTLTGWQIGWRDPVSRKRRTRRFKREGAADAFRVEREKDDENVRAGLVTLADLESKGKGRTTIETMIQQWEAHLRKRKPAGSAEHIDVVSRVRRVMAECKIEVAEHLRREPLIAWLEEYVEADLGAASTHNKYARDLKAFAKWAKGMGFTQEHEGALLESVPETVRYPSRPLPVAEVEKLMAALPELIQKRWVAVRSLTGLRDAALHRLRWSDFSAADSLLRIVPKKGRQRQAERKVEEQPLLEETVDLLLQMRRDGLREGRPVADSDLIFPGGETVTKDHWATARKRAKIDPLAMHRGRWKRADRKCLRNCYQSWLQRAGVSPDTRERLLQHAMQGDRQTYDDDVATMDEKRAGLVKLAAWLEKERTTKLRAAVG